MSNNTSAVKKALSVIETLQAKIKTLEENQAARKPLAPQVNREPLAPEGDRQPLAPQVNREPIAIVGMACRFPGGAETPESFWQLLAEGKDAIIPVPKNRWDVAPYFNDDPQQPGKMYTRNGGYLPQVDQFDPQFFGISPREAANLDPQQRLALELAWEALENANIAADSLYNSETGVFIGISNFEYGAHLLWSGDATRINAYGGTGGSLGVAAGRLSYSLGLTGPSMIVDTACSSSLVTTHLACQSLRAGECRVALSAGVNLIMGPETSINFCKAKMLSPEGRCKTFSASADGYARGEGGGLVVLKRLADAQRDGNQVLAVIQGSAVNQDGPSGGLTVPNGPAQTRVIEKALQEGGLSPRQVHYVEAHGTGTSLGDPIEIRALDRAYKQRPVCEKSQQKIPLLVGSVKTNFGHLESAAGIAGLIKAVLVLQHQQVPAHLHYETPSPHIPWQEVAVKVNDKLQALPQDANGRSVVGVSSFSFAGTNAHVLLQSAPENASSITHTPEQFSGQSLEQSLEQSPEQIPAQQTPRQWHLLPLSAKSPTALNALVQRYEKTLSTPQDLKEVAHTMAVGRSALPCRRVVVGKNNAQVKQRLNQSLQLDTAAAAKRSAGKMAFLFTGQGCQYPGMGKDLYATERCFREAIDHCNALLEPVLNESIIELLFNTPNETVLNQTANTQPLIFALQYGLLKLWQSWGITPDGVLGHSVGEYAAACAAGVLSLEAGCRIISARGELMQSLCQPGAMLAINLSEAEVAPYLRPFKQLSIAAVNGPRRVVVSGESAAIDALQAALTASENENENEIETRRLTVSHGFHSALMSPMLSPFLAVAESLEYGQPTLPIYSNVSGQRAGEEISTAQYWSDHVAATVRFNEGVEALLKDGYRTFVEIGAKPTLCAMVGEIADSLAIEDYRCLPSLRANHAPSATLFESLGQLWVGGATVNWQGVYGDRVPQARLPNYPFQRRSHWINWSLGQGASEEKKAATVLVAKDATQVHPLLGKKFDSPSFDSATQLFTHQLDPQQLHLLAHHRIFDRLVLPAAAQVEMALAAAQQQFPDASSLQIDDVHIEQPLTLAEAVPTPVQLAVNKATAAQFDFQLFSQLEGGWTRHTGGVLRRCTAVQPPAVDLARIQSHCSKRLSVADYYARTRSVGIAHGEKFQAVQALWQGEDEQNALVLAHLQLPAQGQSAAFLLHPVLLDAAFQMVGVPLLNRGDAYLPVGFDALQRFQQAPEEVWCLVRIREELGRLFIADVSLLDPNGACVVHVTGLRFQQVADRNLLSKSAAKPAPLYWVDRVITPAFGEAAKQLPDATSLAHALRQGMSDAVAPVAFYGALFPALDQLVAAYTRAALIDLGIPWQVGECIETGALMQTLGVLPKYQRLLARLLTILSEQGELIAEGEAWRITPQAGEANTRVKATARAEQLATQIAGDFPQAAQELEIVNTCGSALAAVLVGRVDGLQLLFPGGDLSAATRLYADSPGAVIINDLLKQSVSQAIASLSEEKSLRVLELGAGTGGTTAHLLPALQRQLGNSRCEYVFTDISSHFIDQARLRFKDYPFVEFAELDIETPITQSRDKKGRGVKGSFDLIVAANVVHATRDLKQTLTHVYELLAPGGMLFLLEGSAPQPWLDLTFGLTEGWWRFTDTTRRGNYPLMAGQAWRELLLECGFETTAVISPDIASEELNLRQAIISGQKPAAVSTSGDWLLLVDDEGIGEQLAKNLEAQGAHCIVSRQVADLVGLIGDQVKGIINTATLSADEGACQSLIALYQGIDRAQLINKPRVLIATQHAEDIQRSQFGAAIMATAKVAAAEHPEWQNTCVELNLSDLKPDQAAALLLQELAQQDDHVILTQGQRYQQQLRRGDSKDADSLPSIAINADRSYLITGGLGGLGLFTAKWLVEEKGARHLILAGRSEPSDAAQAQLNDLRKQGATVTVTACDVTQADQVKALIRTCGEEVPLAGVIHAAGILDDGALANLTWPRFCTAYAPKATGAWHLHEATANLTLDFFILYSSLASLFCPSGQGSHAASNAALDALAAQRVRRGLPAMSINWGAWTEIGQVGQQNIDQQLEGKGIGTIAPREGAAMLSLIFNSPRPQLVISPMNWHRFFDSELTWAKRSIFAHLRNTEALQATKTKSTLPVATQTCWLESLQGIPEGEQKARVELLIKTETARVLGLDDPSEVSTEIGFFDMGMDSLTSVELRKTMQQVLQTKLPTTTLFKHPTVRELVDYVVSEFLSDGKKSTSTQTINKTTHRTEKLPPSNNDNNEAATEGIDEGSPHRINKDQAAHEKENFSKANVQEMSDEDLSAMIDAELNDVLEDSL